MADVVVVGAGLSGLMAARKVKDLNHSASVVVLEARGRVGGRMVRQEVRGARKGWIDLGGQWLGEKQARVRKLAEEELNLKIFEQYKNGRTVLWYDDHRYLDDNEIAAPSTRAREAAERLSEALSNAADLVVPDASEPWASPLAAAYDRLTLGQWIDTNSDHDYARFYVSLDSTFNQSGGSPREVSLLHALFELKANPPVDEPDNYLLEDAAGQIPPLLYEKLGADKVVQLNSRVVAIHQDNDSVTVTTVTPQGNKEYKGKAVIVAIPPSLTAAISYTSSILGQPGLSAQRMQLTQRMAMGTIAKIACIYDTPWWRTSKEKLSGTSLSNGRLVGATADSGSLGDEGPGILTSFIQGNMLSEWIGLPQEDRKQAVINELIVLFGDDAGSPADYVEALWPQDQFTGGAYNAYLPPGGWTSYGKALREPFGRISWAGTETAVKWYGYFDGAITAGENAAEEVAKKWL